MTFVKERITGEDRAAYAAKGVNISQYDKRWSIDREKDAFLIKIGQDRYDMGGTAHEWWWFYYQGLSLRITCDAATRPDRERNPNFFELPIVKIENYDQSDRKKISLQQLSSSLSISVDELISTLNSAFTNHERYYDTIDDKRDYEYTFRVKFLTGELL